MPSFFNTLIILRLIDIGGQRSERKKWVHCFEDLNAMIYVASLVDYCMVLEEDNMTNRLTESVKLFSAMCNNPYFSSIPIILFLNKKDLFDKKILVCPLEQYFPNYIKGSLRLILIILYVVG
uniref:Guanine nucleotide-binding protein alpha-7 subunit (Trinotate prediction) n=1 Tax=Henneguya salminicola TaxID=69463 RepID=A0A6G3MHJ1_HENSL